MNYPSSYDLLFEFHSAASEKTNPIFTLGITDSYISLSSSREDFSYSDFAESLEKSNKKSGINFTNIIIQYLFSSILDIKKLS